MSGGGEEEGAGRSSSGRVPSDVRRKTEAAAKAAREAVLWAEQDAARWAMGLAYDEEAQRSAENVESRELHYMHAPAGGRTLGRDRIDEQLVLGAVANNSAMDAQHAMHRTDPDAYVDAFMNGSAGGSGSGSGVGGGVNGASPFPSRWADDAHLHSAHHHPSSVTAAAMSSRSNVPFTSHAQHGLHAPPAGSAAGRSLRSRHDSATALECSVIHSANDLPSTTSFSTTRHTLTQLIHLDGAIASGPASARGQSSQQQQPFSHHSSATSTITLRQKELQATALQMALEPQQWRRNTAHATVAASAAHESSRVGHRSASPSRSGHAPTTAVTVTGMSVPLHLGSTSRDYPRSHSRSHSVSPAPGHRRARPAYTSLRVAAATSAAASVAAAAAAIAAAAHQQQSASASAPASSFNSVRSLNISASALHPHEAQSQSQSQPASTTNRTAKSFQSLRSGWSQFTLPASSSLGLRTLSENDSTDVAMAMAAETPHNGASDTSLVDRPHQAPSVAMLANPASATLPAARSICTPGPANGRGTSDQHAAGASSAATANVTVSAASAAPAAVETRVRPHPTLSINTSALGVAAAASSVSSLAATYGSRSSIAAFKRAYAAKDSHKQATNTHTANSATVAAVSVSETKDKDGCLLVSTSAAVNGASAAASRTSPTVDPLMRTPPFERVTSLGSVNVAVDSKRSSVIVTAAEEMHGHVNKETVTVVDGTAASIAAPPPSAVAAAVGAVNGPSFLDPGSARGKNAHARSKSRGAYANMLSQLAAASAAAAATGAADAQAAHATPPAAAHSGHHQPTHPSHQSTVEHSNSGVSNEVRREQIQQLRSSLAAQQQQMQQSGAHAQMRGAQTPAGHRTPGGSGSVLMSPDRHHRDLGSSALVGGGVSFNAESLMTPINILSEDEPIFHEMYKQWFREEIAAERREAKRRAKEAGDGQNYSPSRSLFTPEWRTPLATASADGEIEAMTFAQHFECRTPHSAGPHACYTPGGGQTLLNLLVESNSRNVSGYNTPTAAHQQQQQHQQQSASGVSSQCPPPGRDSPLPAQAPTVALSNLSPQQLRLHRSLQAQENSPVRDRNAQRTPILIATHTHQQQQSHQHTQSHSSASATQT